MWTSTGDAIAVTDMGGGRVITRRLTADEVATIEREVRASREMCTRCRANASRRTRTSRSSRTSRGR